MNKQEFLKELERVLAVRFIEMNKEIFFDIYDKIISEKTIPGDLIKGSKESDPFNIEIEEADYVGIRIALTKIIDDFVKKNNLKFSGRGHEVIVINRLMALLKAYSIKKENSYLTKKGFRGELYKTIDYYSDYKIDHIVNNLMYIYDLMIPPLTHQLEKRIKNLEKWNKQLQSENKEWKNRIDQNGEYINTIQEDQEQFVAELKAENKELIDKLNAYESYMSKQGIENSKLKKEIESLKDHNQALDLSESTSSTENDVLKKKYEKAVDDINDLIQSLNNHSRYLEVHKKSNEGVVNELNKIIKGD